MDNEQLLEGIQKLLEGSEQRIGLRMDGIVERLDSIDRKLTLHAGALAHIIEWSDKYENALMRMSAVAHVCRTGRRPGAAGETGRAGGVKIHAERRPSQLEQDDILNEFYNWICGREDDEF